MQVALEARAIQHGQDMLQLRALGRGLAMLAYGAALTLGCGNAPTPPHALGGAPGAGGGGGGGTAAGGVGGSAGTTGGAAASNDPPDAAF